MQNKQKTLPLFQHPIHAEVQLDGSKSLANRALLVATLAEGESTLENLPINKDVLAGVSALKSLGVTFEFNAEAKTIKIIGCGGRFPNKKADIFCDEAGTLTRFIIPLCAAQSSGSYAINAAPRMKARPIAAQLKILRKMGMQAIYHESKYSLPFTIGAKGLEQDEPVSIEGKQSSQFLSGLLLAAPLLENGLIIDSQTHHPQPYVKMTVELMRDFGVEVQVDSNQYQVKPHQRYQACHYNIEPDLSTASYFWALAAITAGNVTVKHVQLAAQQGDIQFLTALKMMGCKVVESSTGITVIGASTLKGITLNMRHFSDTFMTVAALACFAEGETHLSGLAHTRLQESDRVSAMAEGLTRLGIKVETTEDSIHIFPQQSQLKSGVVEGHNDHRIAMSLALLGLRQKEVIVNGAECVQKTCPDYFERMEKIIQSSQLSL